MRTHPAVRGVLVFLFGAILFLAQPSLLRLFPPVREARIEDRGSRIEERRQSILDPRSSILDPPRSSLPSWPVCLVLIVFHFLVSVYGGYFGAGIGILMLSALALMGLPGVHQMNAVKTFLAFCINGVSVVVFVLGQKVHWGYALVMAVGAILGGYLGARVARQIRPRVVRWFIIAVGLGLAAIFFYKQFAGTSPNAPTNL